CAAFALWLLSSNVCTLNPRKPWEKNPSQVWVATRWTGGPTTLALHQQACVCMQVDVTVRDEDLRIDTYRAGGAGGQHVNKTDSAVRITHLPTNIVVQCQSERSQLQNKETAMKMLFAKLKQKQKEEKLAKVAAIEKKNIEWGSQIRSYVLHPYKMVKDHRTDHESPQPDLVLDGDIMDFIESY